MFVDHLQLADFRSYSAVDVTFGAGVFTLVGANGQGKTNLVEGIEYLSTLSSHRVASDLPLVRAGAERAILRARVQAGLDDPRQLQLEVEITPGKANRAKLNRSPLPRAREILGVLRTVVFSPEDLAVVKGDPSERRKFLDDLAMARWPRMAGVRSDYDRVLRQRNTLLKSLSGRARGGAPSSDAASTLDVWDSHLARVGGEILEARLATMTDLMPEASSAYAKIAPTNNDATASYRTGLELDGASRRDELADLLGAAMQERRSDEIQRGVSLVGPHRDDVVLSLGTLPAKGYASHGESWSLALALKLGSFHLLRADGVEPVLVLDDVFAELDVTRRERLAAAVSAAEQVLVTAAVGADVPERLQGRRFVVAGGRWQPMAEGGTDPTGHDPTGLDLARSIANSVGSQIRRRKAKPRTKTEPQSSGAHPDDRDPQLLAKALQGLVESKGWSTDLNVHTLLGRWPVLVGPTNAAHSHPESYSDGVLTIRADSTVWAASLRTMAPQLVAILNDKLGDGTVHRVSVLGPDAPSWKKGRLSVRDGRGPRDTYG